MHPRANLPCWLPCRGRMYIQLGVPSEGPSAPAGSVEVRPTPDRGNGAFATAAIPAGSHLTDYEGEVINDATFRARYNNGPVSGAHGEGSCRDPRRALRYFGMASESKARGGASEG
eukprot:364759-Chlamydomonas_euryale.AAC.19